jgi:type I restriction enzyme R subunit
VPLKRGRRDYLLLVDRAAVGVIEAKRKGTKLPGARINPILRRQPAAFPQAKAVMRFLHEPTSAETYFRDTRDPEPCSRQVFAFHKPKTLAEWGQQPETLPAKQ